MFSEVWTQQCEQLKHDVVCNLAGNLRSVSAAPTAVADLREELTVTLHGPAFLLDFLRSARGALSGCGLPLLGEATVSCCAPLYETLAESDA